MGEWRTLAEVVDTLERPVIERVAGDPATRVRAITHDSREVVPGSLFVCVPGGRVDGHRFAEEATVAGATALLVERELPVRLPQLVTSDVRASMGWVAAAVEGHPSRRLDVIGVTGTNGKTTTTHLLAAILNAAGRACEVFGTLGGRHTTPEAPELQTRLAAAVQRGARAVAMEVSSHALALHRVDGTHFAAAVFTNLGRDHLDLHGTVERYFAAKASLFTRAFTPAGVVNLDDVHGQLLADASPVTITGYSLRDLEDVVVTATAHAYTWRGTRISVPLGGGFNVSNSLAAATTAAALGIEPEVIAAGLAGAPAVPGRFEPVDEGQPFAVLVDYAHTPDGLRLALHAARSAAAGHRVLVTFGCGGDRDRDKRPEMGAVAAELADMVVVTSDNPRSEDPSAIAASVVAGVPAGYRHRVSVEPDRRTAISEVLRAAGPGDVVLIAGKGHETTQTIGTDVLPFDDRVEARTLLRKIS